MNYSHTVSHSPLIDATTINSDIPLSPGKVVCVGRNYVDHIAELNNAVPSEPLLFMKPTSALVHLDDEIAIPAGELCHNELELALLIQSPLAAGETYFDEQIMAAIWGAGLALDLTLRDLQSRLKQQGHPWERAKSFDGSCPVSGFVPMENIADLQALNFSLEVNQQQRQHGNSAHMIYNCVTLIKAITGSFSLLPGDIVLTGTPKGVGPLVAGDILKASMTLGNTDVALVQAQARVIER